MSLQNLIDHHIQLLDRRNEARKALLDINCEIDKSLLTLKMGAKCVEPGSTLSQSESQAFVEKHGSKLKADDIEFLRMEYRRVGEVVKHTRISASTLKRRGADGQIAIGPRRDGQYWGFSTVSVMEYMLKVAKDEDE